MGVNVLVVDDSSTMRSMVKRTLKMCGLSLGEIHEAANGQEGLDVLEHTWVDIILVDINMPVMGGLEMIDRVRQNPEFAELPIVIVSTESSRTRIEDVHRKGIGFIHKPFTPEVVREVLLNLLGELQSAPESGDAGPGSF